jgi:formylglycine-generating enzyme required for sulfatase activity
VTEKIERVADLYVAKYPVTNKLYRLFIAFLQGNESLVYRAELEKIALCNEWDKDFRVYFRDGKNDLGARFRSKYDEDRKLGGDDQPVVGVSWYAAQAYALWLSLREGKPGSYRLPKEVEWEWAAGGKQETIGQKVRIYPWSDEKGEPTSKLANYNSNLGATTPVGRYPEGATPEGLYDMAGNVWEWMENWYEKDENCHSLRGGSWLNKAYALRCSCRSDGVGQDYWYFNIVGFRVVRSSHSSFF